MPSLAACTTICLCKYNLCRMFEIFKWLYVFSITWSSCPIHLYIQKITTKTQTYVCRLARCLYCRLARCLYIESTSSLLVYFFWAAGFIQYKSIFSIQYYMSQYTKTKLKNLVEFTHKLTIYKILLNDLKNAPF